MSTLVPASVSSGAPTGRREAAAPALDATQQRQAWQREMERAQRVNWFKPALSTRGHDAAPSHGRQGEPEPPRGGERPRHATPVAMRAADSRTAPTAEQRDASALRPSASPGRASAAATFIQPSRSTAMAATAEAACDAPASSPWAAIRPSSALPAPPRLQPADPNAACLNATDAPQSPPASDEAPLRLHAELRPQGQAVWIAMRADDDAMWALLPRIVADLQRGLRERGEQLHQVVCNGRLVWRDGAPVPAHGPPAWGAGRRNPFFNPLHPKEA